MKNKIKEMSPMEKQRIIRGEKQIRDAVKFIDKEVKSILSETSDEDIKYELGKAWGITKEYLNI